MTATSEHSAVHSQSLARGTVGQALFHVERAYADTTWWPTARTHLQRATAQPIDAGEHACLYYGAPAAAFLLHTAAVLHPRCRTAADALRAPVRRIAQRRLTAAAARIKLRDHATFSEYDLFSGLTGLGALLLRTNPECDELADILRYIVALTQPAKSDDTELPGWWVAHHPDNSLPTPGGHANLGIAHGAAGLLAFLAHAYRHGHTVDGHHAAIDRLADWFTHWQQDSPQGPWWPQWITRTDLHTGHTAQPQAGRVSWCYGAIGIARALQLAALATDQPQQQAAAEHALAANLTDQHLDKLTDVGLCHGLAGVYQTAYCAARDARSSAIAERLPVLTVRLLATDGGGGGDRGFLTGSTGFALASATARTQQPPHTGWDTCLLIT